MDYRRDITMSLNEQISKICQVGRLVFDCLLSANSRLVAIEVSSKNEGEKVGLFGKLKYISQAYSYDEHNRIIASKV